MPWGGVWTARSEDDTRGSVIGVVSDFHYASLRQPIGPAVLLIASGFTIIWQCACAIF